MYTGLFLLDAGLAQLAQVNSAANIYYDAHASGNAYLQGRSYAFGSGGGSLVAVVPEPQSAALWLALRNSTAWRFSDRPSSRWRRT